MANLSQISPSFAADAPPRYQRARLFRIYNHYRVVVSFLLLMMLFVTPMEFDSRLRAEGYYHAGIIIYLAINLFIGLVLLAGLQPRNRHIIVSVLMDILVLHGLLLTSTGMTSGLANLVIVTIAAGNILTPSRIGTLYAALGAICSLGIAVWSVFYEFSSVDEIVRAGSLGIVYFATAFILQYISRRMLRSEALASSRARSIAELEQINRQIIQRMRTGILVMDRYGAVRLANAAAEELLFGSSPDKDMFSRGRTLPAPLRDGLEAWLKNPKGRTEPFQAMPTSPMVQANFAHLNQERGDQILVFIDDLSKVTQQAQQMKLASLGRLTAGIAHEIRNPLGAISHASQLMRESEHLDAGDRKMLDIIQRHSRRVNGIIENVLDLSRRREANSDLVQIDQWLPTFRDDYLQTLGSGSGTPPIINLEIEDRLPPARFDVSQIEQVLVNLCDNGLRYSLENTGRPEIELHAGATADGERTYLDVHDSGVGIAMANRTSIFEPFFTTDKGGTGLGLYLARELCESNQAHLSLVDTDRAGCCFRITFAHHGRMI